VRRSLSSLKRKELYKPSVFPHKQQFRVFAKNKYETQDLIQKKKIEEGH
jgi:hypothetical protein